MGECGKELGTPGIPGDWGAWCGGEVGLGGAEGLRVCWAREGAEGAVGGCKGLMMRGCPVRRRRGTHGSAGCGAGGRSSPCPVPARGRQRTETKAGRPGPGGVG